jgi:hypothetical protein
MPNTPAADTEAQYPAELEAGLAPEDVLKIITAIDYLSGLAFSVGAIVKFKAHKDNNIPGPNHGHLPHGLTLLNQFSASHLNASNGSLSDTLISDPNNSVTHTTPLFAHTG